MSTATLISPFGSVVEVPKEDAAAFKSHGYQAKAGGKTTKDDSGDGDAGGKDPKDSEEK